MFLCFVFIPQTEYVDEPIEDEDEEAPADEDAEEEDVEKDEDGECFLATSFFGFYCYEMW